jgi:hypothetical protein
MLVSYLSTQQFIPFPVTAITYDRSAGTDPSAIVGYSEAVWFAL